MATLVENTPTIKRHPLLIATRQRARNISEEVSNGALARNLSRIFFLSSQEKFHDPSSPSHIGMCDMAPLFDSRTKRVQTRFSPPPKK